MTVISRDVERLIQETRLANQDRKDKQDQYAVEVRNGVRDKALWKNRHNSQEKRDKVMAHVRANQTKEDDPEAEQSMRQSEMEQAMAKLDK